MPAAKKKTQSKAAPPASDVDEYLRTLDHPLKPAVEAVRALILGADRSIREGIKWNSPSFRVNEYFATVNIRKDSIFVIFHLGAKKTKESVAGGLRIDDPARLLEWLAKDRAVVKFADLKAVRTSGAAFAKIVRQWIAFVP